MDKKFSQNNFYKALFKKFDNKLIEVIQKQQKIMTVSVDRLETKLITCESSITARIINKSLSTERELKLADGLVYRELKNKIIISNWTAHFLSECDDTLDPLTFAFARFCLSVAICYKDITVQYLIESNVHLQLVNYISFDSELVSGPALLALAHISIHYELKPLIVLAGALIGICRVLTRRYTTFIS